ncbi:unnamed protein product [Amoebophrya sp. A120]|nr:unnamed protein product [Amoebophrya sp. A120]|eukprot:GSA120T00005272001.1
MIIAFWHNSKSAAAFVTGALFFGAADGVRVVNYHQAGVRWNENYEATTSTSYAPTRDHAPSTSAGSETRMKKKSILKRNKKDGVVLDQDGAKSQDIIVDASSGESHLRKNSEEGQLAYSRAAEQEVRYIKTYGDDNLDESLLLQQIRSYGAASGASGPSTDQSVTEPADLCTKSSCTLNSPWLVMQPPPGFEEEDAAASTARFAAGGAACSLAQWQVDSYQLRFLRATCDKEAAEAVLFSGEVVDEFRASVSAEAEARRGLAEGCVRHLNEALQRDLMKCVDLCHRVFERLLLQQLSSRCCQTATDSAPSQSSAAAILSGTSQQDEEQRRGRTDSGCFDLSVLTATIDNLEKLLTEERDQKKLQEEPEDVQNDRIQQGGRQENFAAEERKNSLGSEDVPPDVFDAAFTACHRCPTGSMQLCPHLFAADGPQWCPGRDQGCLFAHNNQEVAECCEWKRNMCQSEQCSQDFFTRIKCPHIHSREWFLFGEAGRREDAAVDLPALYCAFLTQCVLPDLESVCMRSAQQRQAPCRVHYRNNDEHMHRQNELLRSYVADFCAPGDQAAHFMRTQLAQVLLLWPWEGVSLRHDWHRALGWNLRKTWDRARKLKLKSKHFAGSPSNAC